MILKQHKQNKSPNFGVSILHIECSLSSCKKFLYHPHLHQLKRSSEGQSVRQREKERGQTNDGVGKTHSSSTMNS